MTTQAFKLSNPQDDTTTELPLVEGTLGTPGVDVRGLAGKQGVFTYDPAFTATCSCQSDITYIDGENGMLMYRGYSVQELAEKSSFLEVCYLLLNGELPTASEMDHFRHAITHHTMLNESLVKFYDGFHYDAHPMAILTGIVGSLSAFYHDTTDIRDPDHREIFAHRMIAKMPTIAAAAYKHSIGQPKIGPKNHLDYASNFLRMCFAVPAEEYEVDPVAAKALDVLFILHADHEQNASTSTVRLAGSSGANPYACIAAGIASLWGPAHGGANEAVLSMLSEIGDIDNIPRALERAKDHDDNFRLMGFGHRVYKNYDPRAKVMQATCHEVLRELGLNDPLLKLAMELEKIALNDPYFVDRKLYPNVDFYSGITLRALGFPTSMFTVIFALARTVGWVAQWNEMIEDNAQKITRPRQLYTGPTERPFVPLSERS